jgi:hypothetical protein
MDRASEMVAIDRVTHLQAGDRVPRLDGTTIRCSRPSSAHNWQRPIESGAAHSPYQTGGHDRPSRGGKYPFREKGFLAEKKLREAWLAGYRRGKAEYCMGCG